ncbi:FMN-dependent NADH-azoreductase [Frankia canadensis]|uniref:FMN dependent NADH:quinone oxidoreductase n=1 Tax=Frankia canadensis TaxID=1836972 RepID=A0A2I2KU20_9ACTN|nr:NAD(P)H-dependent oxidoreductase [Frankia canadensis]SNQ49163.1 FMN-dependent NADH-azoreductase [Frankia canadensis]SOU56453.1 FMN-dependent NADH-azoreductase [Frankia canadensis]
MAHLLHVDASFAPEGSTSRALGATFVDAWRAAHPGGTITYRDLALTPPPHLDWTAVSAAATPPEQRTPGQNDAVKLREELIGEVETADEYLLSLPMYNFSVPSTFKAWVDQVILVGRTLRQPPERSAMTGRRATVIATQGGSYGAGTPKEGWDHQLPYVAHVLESLGASDVELIRVEMTLAPVNPALAQFTELFESSLAAGEAAARARAAA